MKSAMTWTVELDGFVFASRAGEHALDSWRNEFIFGDPLDRNESLHTTASTNTNFYSIPSMRAIVPRNSGEIPWKWFSRRGATSSNGTIRCQHRILCGLERASEDPCYNSGTVSLPAALKKLKND